MKDLFVSHVDEDATLALGIAAQLESRGYSTWCFELDNAGDYLQGIKGAVGSVRGLLVLVSPRCLANQDQVAREIHLGHSAGKWFIPVQCGLSDVAWDARLPSTWREAFGGAVRVPAHGGSVAATAERIHKSLEARGIEPKAVDAGRVRELEASVERLRSRRRAPAALGNLVDRLVRRDADALWKWGGLVALALLLAAAISSRLPWRAPPSANMASVWITTPQLRGDDLDGDYDALRRMLDDALLRIGGVRPGAPLRILNDSDIDKELLKRGCPNSAMKNQNPACVDTVALEPLAVRVKVEPTFWGLGETRSLTLRIGDGVGVQKLRHTESPRDANIASLADWGAEQIAAFMGVDEPTIKVALQSMRENNLRLEDTLFGAGPAVPPRSSWLDWLVRAAVAAEPEGPDDRAVREVLEGLRIALESRDVDRVEPLFVAMPVAQRDALRRYFASIRDLRIEFGTPEIVLEGMSASAIFLRRDRFTDERTRQPVELALRLIVVLARSDGGWKIQSLQKPS